MLQINPAFSNSIFCVANITFHTVRSLPNSKQLQIFSENWVLSTQIVQTHKKILRNFRGGNKIPKFLQRISVFCKSSHLQTFLLFLHLLQNMKVLHNKKKNASLVLLVLWNIEYRKRKNSLKPLKTHLALQAGCCRLFHIASRLVCNF